MRVFYISPLFLLFLLFLGLKLGGVIAWSWWWVTLPLWCLPAVLLALVLVALLVFAVLYAFSDDGNWRRTGNW